MKGLPIKELEFGDQELETKNSKDSTTFIRGAVKLEPRLRNVRCPVVRKDRKDGNNKNIDSRWIGRSNSRTSQPTNWRRNGLRHLVDRRIKLGSKDKAAHLLCSSS